MHCLNLGLVYTANGGVLMPGPTYTCLIALNISFEVLGGKTDWPAERDGVYSFNVRMTLVQLEFFGGKDTSLKELLIEAWEDYRVWCRDHKSLNRRV